MLTARSCALRRFGTRLLVLAICGWLWGCSATVEWVGVRLLYERASGAGDALLDIPYALPSQLEKHRLDLFLPDAEQWPLLVFVPGGGWTGGDKSLVAGGADVYRNIARFYAGHGIGTALVNYRLQPSVTWREQVDDVAAAVAWLRREIGAHGGDEAAIFLSGHSAGAQLAAFVGLSPSPLAAHGLSTSDLCGVIPVSGAGYDLADVETYELGADRSYYEERFQAGDPEEIWEREASATTWISAQVPPFLLIYGTREWKSLRHQNRLLDRRLREAGSASQLVVARQNHQSMVLALSKAGTLPSAAILNWIRGRSCSGSSAKSFKKSPAEERVLRTGS